jgi:Fe-S-cluster containining protein
VQIICPKCKQPQEVDNRTATCPKCRAIIRRCKDCGKYDIRVSFCRAFTRSIDVAEANYPTFSSDSTYCREYVPGTPAT